jgi:phosphomannomutase
MLRGDLSFSGRGVISGEVGISITPEICIALGAACANLGRVGIGWGGGKAARLMASAMGCGVTAVGGDLIEFDSCFEACMSFSAVHFGLPVTVFVSQCNEKMNIYFYGENGDRITRDRERKIEAALNGDYPRGNEQNIGSVTQIAGIINTYIASAARFSRPSVSQNNRFSVAVSGNGGEKRL